MLYVVIIVLSVMITFTIILSMLLHCRRKTNVKVGLNVFGIKTYMEVTEGDEKPRV